MDLPAEIVDAFQMFGDLDDKVLNKCIDLCNSYNLTAEDLADQWAAFSVSNLQGAAPTLQTLENMERKEYKKKNLPTPSKNIYSTPKASSSRNNELNDTNQIVMEAYSTPKSVKSNKRPCSPESATDKTNFQPNSLNFSPACSPITPSRADYESRTGSGNCLLTFGPQNLLDKAAFKRESDALINIKVLDNDRTLASETRYMYEIMTAKMSSINSLSEWIAHSIIDKYNLEEIKPVSKASGTITTYGIICCDGEGKLNAASVLLESTQELSRGATVQLNLSKLPSYAIFPGQIVVTSGFSPNGNVFVAQKLYTESFPALPAISSNSTLQDSLTIVVAAGPFTLHDNLEYQPLQDLIKYISNNPPHVLILVGPFIDTSHASVCDVAVTESFDDFFETLIDCVMTPLESFNVQVVLVPSHKDAHHHVIYPTLPYTLRKKFSNLHCVPDPTVLDIGGVAISATSADVLLHLGKEEICSGIHGDRVTRLASYIIGQKSFYPLYPPDEEICIDHELLEQFGTMDILPHILILPSNLRYFIKQIEGCVVINPERLAKGYVGGTFGRIQVFPSSSTELLSNNITVQIIRI